MGGLNQASFVGYVINCVCCTVADGGVHSSHVSSNKVYTSRAQYLTMVSFFHHNVLLQPAQYHLAEHRSHNLNQGHAILCLEPSCACKRLSNQLAKYQLSTMASYFPVYYPDRKNGSSEKNNK